jgi:hypothetical protein
VSDGTLHPPVSESVEMERKSGSSSRSPSLTRRPSLKEKKGVTMLVKAKKKGTSGGKKERWLLTRKTWRYMTDAVGNLLPEYRAGSSRRGSTFFQSSSPPISGSGSGSGPRAPSGQLQPHQLQQWTMHQQAWVSFLSSSISFFIFLFTD